MVYSEIQNKYIEEQHGAWVNNLPENERMVVQDMDNGRLGELMQEFNSLLEILRGGGESNG